MNSTCESFGRRLRSERERRGIVLESIAASTKIQASLLADLERGDLSKWPRGIFKRAFVREYAASVGLVPEPIVAECVRLFPDDDSGHARISEQPSELRLTLADGGRPALPTLAIQMTTAVFEICVIVAVARTLTSLTGWAFGPICGATSLTYYGLASALCGCSPGSWWLHRSRQPQVAGHRTVRTPVRDLMDFLVKQVAMQRTGGDKGALTRQRISRRGSPAGIRSGLAVLIERSGYRAHSCPAPCRLYPVIKPTGELPPSTLEIFGPRNSTARGRGRPSRQSLNVFVETFVHRALNAKARHVQQEFGSRSGMGVSKPGLNGTKRDSRPQFSGESRHGSPSTRG
jgi:transcriptional regulator with XRE-family HTH domain